MRKCPGLCSGPGYGRTHCPLFSELLVTLGQLDGTGRLPWAWPPPSTHGRQPGWRDGSQSVRGLGKGFCHTGCPNCVLRAWDPRLGHLGC